MTNGRTGAKGRRGMPPKKVGNGTKTSKDHIGKKIRNNITRRSQVQILLPQFTQVYCV